MMIAMKTSGAGLALMQEFETCRRVSYADPKTGGAPWTNGWGSTGPDLTGPGIVWSQAKCDARFVMQVGEFERIVNAAVTVPLTQGQFDAIVSIVSNVGPGSAKKDGIIRLRSGQPSTLLRKLNAGDYAGAAAQFPLWISPGSNVENGLRRRRAAEVVLFNGRA